MLKLSGIVNSTALAMTLVAGCAVTVEEDGRDDSFVTSGKADSAGVEEGTPEALGVIDVANKVSIEVLEDLPPRGVGLSSRAVDNLMYYRLGDDGLPGTKDDGLFQTLAELDAIPFIGPVAFERLRAYAEANGFVDAHRTPINITFDGRTQPSLVAVRDGLGGAWRRPEKVSGALSLVGSLSFQVRVGARYVIAIVCEDPAAGQVSMYQEAHTLDEAPELFQSCDFTPGPDAAHVTG